MKAESYTAASVFPIKVVLNKTAVSDLRKIRPIHLQINPTNRCNLNCSFCSCSERDKSKEIDFDLIRAIITKAAGCGCKAVTITGGGEPCLYTYINELIDFIGGSSLKIGLVTNGTSFDKLKHDTYSKITWLRISHSDYRPFNKEYRDKIEKAISIGTSVDWAFSYVVTTIPKPETIIKIINFSNDNGITHIRLVSDILDTESEYSMDSIKKILYTSGVDTSLIIYQSRKVYVKGRKKCLISLLKPVVGVDGCLYPCCGVQFSRIPPANDYNDSVCMGKGMDIDKLYKEQLYYDGSDCARCYYDEYNVLLDKMTAKIEHIDFV